jgi:hypothetical protein
MNFFPPLIRLFLIFFFSNIFLYFLPHFSSFSLPFNNIALITSGSFIISVTILIIFLRGFNKGGKIFLMHTLAAISLKFLLYLILLLIIYFLIKNLSLEFVLTFFGLYLTFTSYLMFSFIKLLKTKTGK